MEDGFTIEFFKEESQDRSYLTFSLITITHNLRAVPLLMAPRWETPSAGEPGDHTRRTE